MPLYAQNRRRTASPDEIQETSEKRGFRTLFRTSESCRIVRSPSFHKVRFDGQNHDLALRRIQAGGTALTEGFFGARDVRHRRPIRKSTKNLKRDRGACKWLETPRQSEGTNWKGGSGMKSRNSGLSPRWAYRYCTEAFWLARLGDAARIDAWIGRQRS